MADDLRPAPIRDLQLLGERGRRWIVDRHLEDLASLTPVRGWIHAVHRGSLLEVEGEAGTIVNLCCDRCLQRYNHTLHCRTKELIWLEGEATCDRGAPGTSLSDDLSERLDPCGCFDPSRWIFEHLHLQHPLVRRCGPHCPGPALPGGTHLRPADSSETDRSEEACDPRWEILRQLQRP